MKYLRIVTAGLLLLTIFVLPSSAFAADKPVTRTLGEMTDVTSSWWGSSGPVTFTWKWSICGATDTKPASGRLTYTITEPAADGKVRTLESNTVNVVTVTRSAANVVEATFDGGVDAPGDPSWPSNRLRFIDNGKSGDELLMWCWRCNFAEDVGILHSLSNTGQIKVR